MCKQKPFILHHILEAYREKKHVKFSGLVLQIPQNKWCHPMYSLKDPKQESMKTIT